MATRKATNNFEERYFDLIQDSLDRLEVKIDGNTKLTEATKAQAEQTNGKVAQLRSETDKLNKEVFGKVRPSDLPKWYKDPKTIFNISLGFAILAAVIARLVGVDTGGLTP